MKKLTCLIVFAILSIGSVFALEEGMLVQTLPSGQKVVVKEVRDNNIVKIDTWINTGSINEDDKTNGISHFLEHLFFKGTQKYPTGTFDKILDSKGANVNAATSKDYTHYYIEIPSKDFDLALNLHADMLLNPLIPRKELERERNVVIEEISKTKDSPTNRMFDNIYTSLYASSNHPYKRTVIGKKDIIQTVSREEILNYYKRFYTPDAFTTVIVGDVNKNEAVKKVAEAFKENTKRKQEKVVYPAVKPLKKNVKTEDTMDINQTYYMMAYLAPKFKITNDNYALDVLSAILSSGKSSILKQDLKEKKELVLSIDTGNYSQKDSGLFYIFATLDPSKEQYVEEEILKELNKIKNGQFEEERIARAINLIKTNTYYSRESISNIADDIGYDFTFAGNDSYYENYLKNISRVTKKDIQNVAKKYFTNYAVSIVRPKNFKPVSNIEQTPVKKENKLIQELDKKKKYLLSNGATLTVKNKNTNSIVAIDISIKGSKAVEKKPATALLTALTSTKGTKNYSNAEFSEFLDENGIKLSVSASNDVFSIVAQTTIEHLDEAFRALDEVINKASFLDSEIEKVKQRKINELSTISDNPSSYVFDEFKKLAFPNSIYGQNATFLLNSIKNVNKNDILEYYSRIINPENMYITIVGNIDDKYISDKLNEIIKKNPKGSKFEYTDYKYNSFRPEKNVETTLYKNEVEANWMALGFKTCGINNRKDIAVLNVINSILGEGMSSRLFLKLREEKGLAYTVGSTLSTNIKDGAFIAYIGTNDKSIQEAKNGILNEINTIKTEMVTTKELNDAKDKIMGKFLLSLETNMDEADILNWYSVLGRNLNALEEYKELIMNVTQADIIETANKYFSKPYIYTVVRKK